MRPARLLRADARPCRAVQRRDLSLPAEDPADAFVRSRGPLRRVLTALCERFVSARGREPLGFARLGDWARERVGLSARQVQDLARTGAALERLPLAEAALVSGALPWSKVRLVCRVARPDARATGPCTRTTSSTARPVAPTTRATSPRSARSTTCAAYTAG